MSEAQLTLTGLAVKLLGVIILVLGLLLAYFSLNADIEVINPRIFTPIGLMVALLGGFMLLAKEV